MPTPNPVAQVAKLDELTNQQRTAHGIQSVRLSSALNQSAQNHAQDLALHNFVSHTGSDGSSIGENI